MKKVKRNKKQTKKRNKEYQKPLHLDMPFEEALSVIVKAKPTKK